MSILLLNKHNYMEKKYIQLLETVRDETIDYIGSSIDHKLTAKLEKLEKELTDIIMFDHTNEVKHLIKTKKHYCSILCELNCNK